MTATLPASQPTPPLSNIRVLDLTRLLPGPLCTQHLADMGADVIKVEDPVSGDYARTMRGYYELVNRNKRSIKVDLKKDLGKELFLRLCTTADVIVEGFRPGVMDRLDVGYSAVSAENENIVYCSISGYGQTGPFRLKAGHDLNYCSFTGISDQIGQRGSEPTISNLQIADFLGGTLSAVMGILAALVDARSTGRGRYIDVAMADCSLAHNIMPLMALNERGKPDPRGGGYLSGGLPWYSIYKTADDKYVSLGALEPKFWTEFCVAIGRPEWSDKQSAEENVLDDIHRELTALFLSKSQAFWMEHLEHANCCFSPVLPLDQTVKQAQFKAREMLIERNGKLQYGFPIKFSDFEFEIKRDAPEHGEHTVELLAELGYSEEERANFEFAGVI